MTNRTRAAIASGVLALTSPVRAASELPPSVQALVERVRETWGPLRVSLVATMTSLRPGRDPSQVTIRVRRAGDGRTRVDFLEPAEDRGKVVLRLAGETWLYLPAADRVVEVPPGRNPLAAGVLFEDLVPGAPALASARVERGEDGWVLVCAGGRNKAESRIWFDAATGLPRRREVYGSAGRLVETMHVEETRAVRGVEVPWRVRHVDGLREGRETLLEVVSLEDLPPGSDAIFSKEGLGGP